MIDAEEWYKAFKEEFVKTARDANSEIGIHYEKYRVRGTETNIRSDVQGQRYAN